MDEAHLFVLRFEAHSGAQQYANHMELGTQVGVWLAAWLVVV